MSETVEAPSVYQEAQRAIEALGVRRRSFGSIGTAETRMRADLARCRQLWAGETGYRRAQIRLAVRDWLGLYDLRAVPPPRSRCGPVPVGEDKDPRRRAIARARRFGLGDWAERMEAR